MPISEELKKILIEIRDNQYSHKVLSLSESEVDDEAVIALFDALQNNHFIEKIDLSNNEIGPEGVKYLCQIKVKGLSLSGNPIGEGAKLFEKSFQIEELILAGCGISSETAKLILKNVNLKMIDLSGNNLKDDALSEIPENNKILLLAANQNNLTVNGARWVGKLRHIIVLDLGSNKIGDEGAGLLAENTSLKRLFLLQNGITKIGFSRLCQSNSIQELFLYNNDIEFSINDTIPKNTSFVKLNLSFNKIDGLCKEVLGSLASIPTLKELNLEYNNIDDNGMKVLYEHKSPSLHFINLLGNPIRNL